MEGTSQVLLKWSNPFLSHRCFGGFGADRVAGLILYALMASVPQKAAGFFVLLGCAPSSGSHVAGGAAGLGAIFHLTLSQVALLPAVRGDCS